MTIAHPTPKEQPGCERPPPGPKTSSPRKFTGVMTCADCHSGPKFNFQFSQWRLSKHAQAYAVLGTPKGFEIAQDRRHERRSAKGRPVPQVPHHRRRH